MIIILLHCMYQRLLAKSKILPVNVLKIIKCKVCKPI